VAGMELSLTMRRKRIKKFELRTNPFLRFMVFSAKNTFVYIHFGKNKENGTRKKLFFKYITLPSTCAPFN